jgi:hypothetical protein
MQIVVDMAPFLLYVVYVGLGNPAPLQREDLMYNHAFILCRAEPVGLSCAILAVRLASHPAGEALHYD